MHRHITMKEQYTVASANDCESVMDLATENEKAVALHLKSNRLINGGADGTRTRDLRRDRPAF